jgi:hypothetical protein
MKPVSRRRDAGFSLPEAIAGFVIFTIMMGALTYAAAALFKFQSQPSVIYGGQTYALAPSLGSFQQAVSLQTAFAQAVDQADNLIVIGGVRSSPTAANADLPASALATTFADASLSAAISSDPFQAYSSWDQVQLNSLQFSPYFTVNPDPADFTILTVQGQSRITSITQQRRVTATINGLNQVLYQVTSQTIDWSSGSPVLLPNAQTGTTPTYGYAIYYPAAEDSWAQAPGVTHYWYRTDATWDRDQEGPSRVIFADPYVLAGQDPQAPIQSVSRFVYFLPQTR